jgi:hypothetical protein
MIKMNVLNRMMIKIIEGSNQKKKIEKTRKVCVTG